MQRSPRPDVPAPALRRLLAAACLALAAAGCAAPHAQGGSAPVSADVPHVPPLVAQMASPEEVARWAARECGGGRREMPCYDGVLHAVLAARGVRPAMETLERLTPLDPDVMRDGHVYAHGIGIAAYRGAGQVAATFAECTPLHQSGCYHGVIQAYFADMQAHGGGVSTRTVDAACSEQTEPWLLFQCAHGVGHGLTALYGHDLPRALAGCDLLSSPYQREACYGGAFMENVVAVSSPQHHHEIASALERVGATPPPADEHAGMAGMEGMEGMHDEHSGHAQAGEADHAAHAAAAWRPVDRADPQYPCSVLGARYQAACYSMQTSVMLYLADGDVATAARGCAAAPERMRATCFVSLGRDINAIARQRHAAAARLCGLASEEFRPWCHQGVAKNLIDLTSRAEDGAAYCGELRATPDRSRCYHAVGEELRFLTTDPALREAGCRGANPADVDACRRGAGLADERPGAG